jgi:4-amino-4-deoxy-L-arabinose transferase-like glycosyltransferase
VACAWLLSGVFYLTLPPNSDQFELDYMGWRIVEGDVPYRDFIDTNWPGPFWLHALSTAVFGNRIWSWRALDFLGLAMSAAFLADLLRRSTGKASARFLLLILPLLYAGLSEWVSGQQDMSAAHLLCAVLWFHSRAQEPGGWGYSLGAGAFLGAAMLVKPTAGALGALLAAQALLLGVPFWRAAGQAALEAAAAIAVLASGFAILLGTGASARDILDCAWTANVHPPADWTRPLMEVLTGLIFKSGWWLLLSVASLPGALRVLRKEHRSIGSTAPLVLWITGLASYWFQRRGVAYHLSFGFPAMAALMATGLGTAWETPGRLRRCAAGLLVVILFVGWRWGRNYNSVFQDRHYRRYQEAEGLTIAEAIALAARMEREVPRDESVLAFGCASSMNFLARRRQPSHFIYVPILMSAVPPFPLADHWADVWDQDLGRSVPRWCLVPADCQEWLERDVRPAKTLRTLLARSFQREGIVGRNPGLILYVRKTP